MCDLIKRLNDVKLDNDCPLLNGKEVRALQLADDLAIIARSPEDLQKLLDEWERFCDDHHQLTQIKKSEVVVFTSVADENSLIIDDTYCERLPTRGSRCILNDIPFVYKNRNMKTVESFVYLGLLFHWKESGAATWADRESTAYKAFGSLLGALHLVPFLPFNRVSEVVGSIVGGAYLYGAEVWAPFIPRSGATPGSRISRQVLSWVTGMGSARVDRCRGWVNIRELDVEAESRALRALQDAVSHGGLLATAVIQLQNFF